MRIPKARQSFGGLGIRQQNARSAGEAHNLPGVFRETDRQRRISFPEVITMLISVWLMLSSLLYALRVSPSVGRGGPEYSGGEVFPEKITW